MTTHPLLACAYRSTAQAGLTELDLTEILTTAWSVNSRDEISGVLLYDGACFYQYIEGPSAKLEHRLARILSDPRHSDILIQHPSSIATRACAGWTMHFFEGPVTPEITRAVLAGMSPDGQLDPDAGFDDALLQHAMRARPSRTG